MTSSVAAFTQFGCFWSSHMNNQRKCQLGDYDEETIGGDYDSPKHISFTITNLLYTCIVQRTSEQFFLM